MSRYPQFNVGNDNQLIRRQNTYNCNRKLITIHSEDRDISKWPNSNHFEITLPQDLINVQSLRLVEIQLPANYYVFSNALQNTKLQFYLTPSLSTQTQIYTALGNRTSQPYEITIQEGSYTEDEMANELTNLMNDAVQNYLRQDAGIITATYDRFSVFYDKVSSKMYFGNNFDKFSFNFSQQIAYNLSCETTLNQRQPIVWNQYANWGLPYNLGFEKKSYQSQGTIEPIKFNYNNYTWLTPDPTYMPNYPANLPQAYYLTSSLSKTRFYGDSVIYMELDKYNSYDELDPYKERTNNMYNNDYSGRVNSAFAKIPLNIFYNRQYFDSRNAFLQNVSQYTVPIEKIRKLKFLFRYHDGRLVDFNNQNFNFTISFNQLIDEIARDMTIRVPVEYNL